MFCLTFDIKNKGEETFHTKKTYLTKQQTRVLAQELVQFNHLAGHASVQIMFTLERRICANDSSTSSACFLPPLLPSCVTHPNTGNSLPSLKTTRASTVSRLTCKLPFCFLPRPRLVTLARFIMAEVASAAVAPGAAAASPPPPPPPLLFPAEGLLPSGRNSTRAIVTLSCRQACNAAFSLAVLWVEWRRGWREGERVRRRRSIRGRGVHPEALPRPTIKSPLGWWYKYWCSPRGRSCLSCLSFGGSSCAWASLCASIPACRQ